MNHFPSLRLSLFSLFILSLLPACRTIRLDPERPMAAVAHIYEGEDKTITWTGVEEFPPELQEWLDFNSRRWFHFTMSVTASRIWLKFPGQYRAFELQENYVQEGSFIRRARDEDRWFREWLKAQPEKNHAPVR